MTDTEPEPEPGSDPNGDTRRRVGLAVLGAAIVIAIVLLVTSPWSSDDDTRAGTDATSTTAVTTSTTTTAPATTTPPTTPASAPATPDGGASPEQVPADQVPVATIDVTGPGGACAEVVARLKLYSAAAKASAIPDLRTLFEKLSEFEAEIFQYAQGEAWGDPLIEQLVVVRRGWVDAGASFDSGDETTAQRQADEANELLDTAIASAAC